MESITKQIEELQQKAEAYDNMKNYYDTITQQLINIQEQIKNVITTLKPTHTTRKTYGSRTDIAEKIKELHQLMINGTHITKEHLINVGINEGSIGKTFEKITMLPNVKKVKDNGRVRLYIE